ncbi:MAG TPA: hypothetical protein VGA00_04515 [Acidiferrobacterales bacterium]|jgi:hypothetical protein
MENFRCAFSATLITGDFGCRHAVAVTRRGGPDIACAVQAAHERCEQLFERLKSAALPAFGVEDDLNSMPHSVLVKIQYGGLAGLQQALDAGSGPDARVADIDALVARAVDGYGGADGIPVERFVEAMTAFKLRRRSR